MYSRHASISPLGNALRSSSTQIRILGSGPCVAIRAVQRALLRAVYRNDDNTHAVQSLPVRESVAAGTANLTKDRSSSGTRHCLSESRKLIPGMNARTFIPSSRRNQVTLIRRSPSITNVHQCSRARRVEKLQGVCHYTVNRPSFAIAIARSTF